MIPDDIASSKRQIRQLGWKPDIPDHRDRWLLASVAAAPSAELPARTINYLGHSAIPIYDQSAIGSCTANAAGRGYRIAIRRTVGGLHDFDLSRLAHYYWTRAIDGSEDYDAGAYIRDTMKVFARMGAAPEKLWPYIIKRFAQAPPPEVIEAAKRRIRVEYLRVNQTAAGIRATLAARHPIVFGMAVFDSTMDALENTGLVPFPGENERVLGGHAMLIEDYDDVTFGEPVGIGANSWGPKVGIGAPGAAGLRAKMAAAGYKVDLLGGYFVIPLRILTNRNIADDFWTITAAA